MVDAELYSLEIAELPQFHAVTEAQKRGGGGNGRGNDELAASVDAVLSSKIARGALTSILGPGFVGNVPLT